jgi:hypothetical protein
MKPEYDPVKDALEAGLKNMEKWNRKTDNTSIYFVCHGIVSYEEVCFTAEQVLLDPTVLDPVQKLTYLEVAWEDEWVAKAMARMKTIVSCFTYGSFSFIPNTI